MARSKTIYLMHDVDSMQTVGAFTVKHEAVREMQKPEHDGRHLQLESGRDGGPLADHSGIDATIVATKYPGGPVNLLKKSS